MPGRKRDREEDERFEDELEEDEDYDYGDLTDEEIDELEGYVDDFPELDYLDDIDNYDDDEDFYSTK